MPRSVSIEAVLDAVGDGESVDWEFKSARGGFPSSFWQTYCAMANTQGGVIILGVSEAPSGARLDGLDAVAVARCQKTLWDNLNNRDHVSCNLLAPGDVEVLSIDDVRLVAVRVPRAERSQRPVFLGRNPFGGTYRRFHEGDYRCTDSQVRRMVADSLPETSDQCVLPCFTLDDLDPSSVAQYRQRFRGVKGEHPWLGLDDGAFLERLGAWRRDRRTLEEGVTLAGLLMFGRDRVLRVPEAAPEFFVDFRERLDSHLRWTDRVYPDGTWDANLFQFYSRIWPRLAAALPVPFRLEDGVRRDETAAHQALREAFVNALIHADHNAPGGVVVERHPDRIVIENPGTFLVSYEQYQRGGVSECRNRALQQMFLFIGGGERAGSGADRIRSGWRDRHWRPPHLELRDHPDRVSLTLPTVSLIPEETLERLRLTFGGRLEGLSAVEIQALATAELEGSVSNVRLQELVAEHPADITRCLQGLCERGFLSSDNRRRWAQYRLRGGDSVPLGGGSVPLGGDSVPLGEDSVPLGGDSARELSAGTREVWSALAELAAPVADRGKASSGLIRDVIRRLCSGRFLTCEELGRLLRRNPSRLRRIFVSPMVRAGTLRLKFPTSLNRPDQAYIATDEEEDCE